MVPLHVHSYYSLLQSSSSLDDLLAFCVENEIPSLGLTDRDGLYGAVHFYQKALAVGILPVIGSEITLEDGASLVLLAKDIAGYSNLCRILSLRIQYPQGIPVAQLQQRAQGLIALSGCSNGQSRQQAHLYGEIFPDRFWLEVQHHGRPEDDRIVENTIALSRKSGLPLVATPNVHYTCTEDRNIYEILSSIGTQTSWKQTHPKKHLTGDYSFPTPCEMALRFRDIPEALKNSDKIAEMCRLELPLGKPIFPDFQVPDGFSPQTYLKRLCYRGAKERYGEVTEIVEQRLEHELSTIHEVGYDTYFLIVWDLVQEAQRRNIWTVARGSASDSLVCYVLGISHVCPISYGLYFERFLNRERVKKSGLADIDLDIPWDRRDELIEYVYEKYGPQHTATIGSISTFHIRSAVADVGKVLGLSEREVRRFTRSLKDLPREKEPYRTILSIAERIEGFPRHTGMHPCGIVIGREDLNTVTPLEKSSKGPVVTQYEMHSIEELGLVKMDLLGQAGLTVIVDAVDMVRESDGEDIDVYALPQDDSDTWDIISAGETRGCFQIESPAMCNLLRRLNCRDMECLIAALSLIRPGAGTPEKINQYARRHMGIENTEYVHPSVEPGLRDTYGLMVYEEHILMVAHLFAGMDLGRADLLRRALVKQSDRHKAGEFEMEFREGAKRLRRRSTDIDKVWRFILEFCGYSFNKAHSSSYAVLAYQAAWLKRRYPAEFLAAVLASGRGFYSRLTYILEAKRLGIEVLGPSVNNSRHNYHVTDGCIRVPLYQIKGLSNKTIGNSLREGKKRAFTNWTDFNSRVRPRKSEAEKMIMSGACDDFGLNRPALLWELRTSRAGDIETSERDLFSAIEADANDNKDGTFARDYCTAEKIALEMKLMDLPVSGHPLEMVMSRQCCQKYNQASDLEAHSGKTVRLAGIIVATRDHRTQRGEPMRFLTLSDFSGMAEVVLFPQTCKQFRKITSLGATVEVTGQVQVFESGRGATVIASGVDSVDSGS